MAIIVQQKINNFLSTNIEEDYLEYSANTTYTVEDEASLTSASVVRVGGFYYRSLADNNLNNDPLQTLGIWWVKWSVSNNNAMLDYQSLTKTTITLTESDADYLSTDTLPDIPINSLVWDVVGLKMYESLNSSNVLPNTDFTDTTLWKNKSDIIVEFERGVIDTIGLGYLETSKIIIEHYDSLGNKLDEVTREKLYSINNEIYDLWDYIYEPYSILFDREDLITIPPIGYKIRLTIERQSITNTASCGFIIGGEALDIGETENGANLGFTSFSIVEDDDFGTTNILKRNIKDNVTFVTWLDRIYFQKIKRDIKVLKDEIVMFVLDERGTTNGFDYLITLGKIEDASLVAEKAQKTIINWSISESI